jgi:hypothetical protein
MIRLHLLDVLRDAPLIYFQPVIESHVSKLRVIGSIGPHGFRQALNQGEAFRAQPFEQL